MKDLTAIINDAIKRTAYFSLENTRKIFQELLMCDKKLSLNWDDGAGEGWAFINSEDGLTIMLHTKLELAFVRGTIENPNMKDILAGKVLIQVDSFDEKEWSIDLGNITVSENFFNWHSDESTVDTSCMSLDELYFATV